MTHLIEQGHRRIGFVGDPKSTVQVAGQHRGALRALSRAGLPSSALTVLETSALTVDEGRGAAQRVIGMPTVRGPTAVFCSNDLVALSFLQEMTSRQIAVHDEMAIVGYDDIEFAEAAAVPLTSVRQPRDDLGRTACELLLAEAADLSATEQGDGVGHVHRQIQFAPELVVRASSMTRVAAPGSLAGPPSGAWTRRVAAD